MPITQAAKKALRASNRKRVFNLHRATAMKDAIKDLKKLVDQKETKKAQDALPGVYKAIDKAAKRGIIKPNTASRKKSRLTKLIKSSK
tara:strand:+ start:5930 stop:6193 length:264 start_codon:yes stop_codon:yes gene_type:complete